MKKKRILSICVALSLIISGVAITSFAEDKKEVDPISFFEIEGATAELKEETLDFTLTEETATIQFENPLAASGFSFNWNGVDDKEKKLETLAVVLADSEDAECSVKINFMKLNDQNTAVRYNEEPRSYLTAGATYLVNAAPISLKFNESTQTFTDGTESYKIVAESCMNGTVFNGFESKGIMLTISVTGQVGASFSINSINEQPFGKNYVVDNVEPILCVPNGQTKMMYNSVSTLPKAAAFDVFSKETTLKLTVQDPEGNVIKDEAGVKLEDVDGNQEYQIKFSKYGSYRVIYVASDGLNKTRGMGYQINVQDEGAPVIILKKAMKESVVVGDEVFFPEFEISDNVGGEFVTWMNVLHPTGHMTCEKTSFIPDVEGKYVITFCAQDANGNIGRFVTNVYAEGGSK